MESQLNRRDIRRKRRSLRVRKKVRGTADKPRLSVFRSNAHIAAQLIDDESHKTLFGIGTNSKELQQSGYAKKSKDAAKEIGKKIAQAAKKHNVENVVFDRGHYKYHGVIAQLADAAREEGLRF
jgi:large subunit ribosomal protein L18